MGPRSHAEETAGAKVLSKAGTFLAGWSTVSVSKQRAVRRITGELKKWVLARSHEALQTMKTSLAFIPVAEEFTGRCLL